jgi:hypothetical protein
VKSETMVLVFSWLYDCDSQYQIDVVTCESYANDLVRSNRCNLLCI